RRGCSSSGAPRPWAAGRHSPSRRRTHRSRRRSAATRPPAGRNPPCAVSPPTSWALCGFLFGCQGRHVSRPLVLVREGLKWDLLQPKRLEVAGDRELGRHAGAGLGHLEVRRCQKGLLEHLLLDLDRYELVEELLRRDGMRRVFCDRHRTTEEGRPLLG